MTAVTSVIGARAFELSYYGAWDMNVAKVATAQQMYLLCSSPGDGVISDSDMAAVRSAWSTAVAAIALGTPAVTAVSPSQSSSSSPPPQPWAYGGFPRLVFDMTWTMVGFEIISAVMNAQAFLAIWSSTETESFTSAQVTSIANAIQTALAACSGVSGVIQAAQIIIAPSTVK